MAERRIPPYPSIDDPARYDRIVQRGRSMRRRRQFGVGAGAGGSVAAVALAVVMLTGGTDPTSDVVADGDREPVVETTTTTTTTLPPTELTVEVGVEGDTLLVDVHDPAQPVAEDSRQCVLVTVTGPDGATAEGYGCDDVEAVDGVVPVEVATNDGIMIGCAASLLPPVADPEEYPTAEARTLFEATMPDELPAGAYQVELSVTSGVGDGCAGGGDQAEPGALPVSGAAEHATSTIVTLDLG